MKLIEDQKGNISSMRIAFLALIVYAMVFGGIVVFKEGSINALAFIGGVVSVAGGMKLIQNPSEKK